ncbi:MAG: hypothetical protein ACTSRP_22885 [Candidatus Helarchaeota archaeon]
MKKKVLFFNKVSQLFIISILIFSSLFTMNIKLNSIISIRLFQKINNGIYNIQSQSNEITHFLEWETILDGGFRGTDVIVDANNDIYFSGRTNSIGAGGYDAFLFKYDQSGKQLWNRTWGGSDNEFNEKVSIEVDSFNNIYLTGETKSFGESSGDAFIVKYNTSGYQQWNATWGGLALDTYEDIVIDKNDNIYITGFTYSFGAGLSDVLLVKYDINGHLLWNKTWGGYR